MATSRDTVTFQELVPRILHRQRQLGFIAGFLTILTSVALVVAIANGHEGVKDANHRSESAQGTADRAGIRATTAKRKSIHVIKYLRGEQGIPGVPGRNGTPGLPGLPGLIGNTGPVGLPGLNGSNGSDGTNGSDGQDGAPGQNGQNGADGSQGPPGPPGPQGDPGPPPSGSYPCSFDGEFMGQAVSFAGTCTF